jgi:hypothetical protein
MILDKSDKVSGYRRAKRIIIDNPKDGTPIVGFELEWATDIDGKPVFIDAGSLSEAMSDPTTYLEIINPITDTKIMDANYGFVQAVLYSLYMKLVANSGV